MSNRPRAGGRRGGRRPAGVTLPDGSATLCDACVTEARDLGGAGRSARVTPPLHSGCVSTMDSQA